MLLSRKRSTSGAEREKRKKERGGGRGKEGRREDHPRHVPETSRLRRGEALSARRKESVSFTRKAEEAGALSKSTNSEAEEAVAADPPSIPPSPPPRPC